MCVLLMLFAALLHATSTVNALDCWVGWSTKMTEPSRFNFKSRDSIRVDMSLTECPNDTTHCAKVTCERDTEALREMLPGEHISDGARSTKTMKGCMPPGECEIPNEFNDLYMRKQKKYCRISCCTGYACNGTLGLRSFGTLAAMIAFVAAFFVRWN